MTELYWKPAHELAAMIRKRELKPSELMDVTIRRIEQTNPKINAFVALRADAAMKEARALDEKIARGEQVGTLAGLPLGVKDLEDTVGLVNSHGSKPFKDNMSTTDSIQVARLKAAGAIVIGKTNAPEFGYTAFTKNLLFGPTRNPWNLERTPGGSSGGTSAAIAGGVVPISTGSDGGGSVRIPACYTGCYGLKPNYGRIPNDPTLGMQQWNDTSRARSDHAHRPRRRDLHGRGRRLSPGRSRLAAASGNFLRRDSRRAAEKIAHRVSS